MQEVRQDDVTLDQACPLCRGEVQVRGEGFGPGSAWICLTCGVWSKVPVMLPPEQRRVHLTGAAAVPQA